MVFDQVLYILHYIGPHSDNERQIEIGSPILAVSLGAERVFRIRADKKIVLDLKMPDNSYVIMGGKMQQQFTHEVPKSKRVTERRISITFRKFVN